MKTYWGVEAWIHAFLASGLDGGEWSASLPGHFTSRERTPGSLWEGDWVVPRAVLDAVVKGRRPVEIHLTLKGRNIPFVKYVKYLGVVFDKKITWRLRIEMITVMAFRKFVRVYSPYKSERLSTNIKLPPPPIKRSLGL